MTRFSSFLQVAKEIRSTVYLEIHRLKRKRAGDWYKCRNDSRDYTVALGIGQEELEALDDIRSGVRVPTIFGDVWLISVNTCGCPYGGDWTHLLQARPVYREIEGVGGGTTFIAVLRADEKAAVIEAIRADTAVVGAVHRGVVWR